MQFQTKILLLSFVASVFIAIIVIPILKKLKVGQIERKEGPQSHLKKQGTPTMGGVIMILVIVAVTAFCWYDYSKDECCQKSITIIICYSGFWTNRIYR